MPDDVVRAIQEQRHKILDQKTDEGRLVGDAVIAGYFVGDKPKARKANLASIENAVGKSPPDWEVGKQLRATLLRKPYEIKPFHWEFEFPEVFSRQGGGFDAIVGNPPFAGKNTIIGGNSKNYLPWLQTLHADAHGNADLVAHFFRRAFGLLRQGGVFGLIATNTMGQGDTRASGLTKIIADGGAILRATRRLKWPGEAAVVVSVVHIIKGNFPVGLAQVR